MSLNKKLIWGGLGWVFAGPIGAILGYTYASMSGNGSQKLSESTNPTKHGDFIISVLVLFAKVMKADGKLLKSELDYVKNFLKQQFGIHKTKELMTVFKDILEQDYPLKDVCKQIQRSMDHPSRLELIHILYGLSASDGHVHPEEIKVIQTMANYLNINKNDYESIKAMFAKDEKAIFRVLEISPNASNNEIKRAYRKMANKYHPDKVAHLGKEMQNLAEDKFKAVNDAYQQLKKDRDIS
ncbi:MAG: molecular chaperone DjlA [Candidatus Marinimicrobia bacterium]|nr:molecular chaperone DjlA [Candidatus Neomarinimicrobiota bacterium]|tara:strand:- start:780 stop:1499 length:720 start_codon:yes stop_codon:yes gene_type:complete